MYGSPTGSENSSSSTNSSSSATGDEDSGTDDSGTDDSGDDGTVSGTEDPDDEGSGAVASAITRGVLPSTGGPLPLLAGLGVMLVVSGAFMVRRFTAGR